MGDTARQDTKAFKFLHMLYLAIETFPAFFLFLPGGNITGNYQPTDGISRIVPQVGNDSVNPNEDVVTAFLAKFKPIRTTGIRIGHIFLCQSVFKHPNKLIDGFCVKEVIKPFFKGFRRCKTEHGKDRRTDICKVQIQVEGPKDIRHIFGEQAIAVFTFTQCRFSLMLFCHVTKTEDASYKTVLDQFGLGKPVEDTPVMKYDFTGFRFPVDGKQRMKLLHNVAGRLDEFRSMFQQIIKTDGRGGQVPHFTENAVVLNDGLFGIYNEYPISA